MQTETQIEIREIRIRTLKIPTNQLNPFLQIQNKKKGNSTHRRKLLNNTMQHSGNE